jgi:hypothetical protein
MEILRETELTQIPPHLLHAERISCHSKFGDFDTANNDIFHQGSDMALRSLAILSAGYCWGAVNPTHLSSLDKH